jgi:hypothetical protein
MRARKLPQSCAVANERAAAETQHCELRRSVAELVDRQQLGGIGTPTQSATVLKASYDAV